MTSPSHWRARALVRRYLDARRTWAASHDRRLREHLRECDECAGFYDRAVTLHRALVGAPADLPSGFEQQRMMEAAVGGLAPAPAASPLRWLGPVAAGLAAAAAVAVFVTTPGVRERVLQEADQEYVGARGSQIYGLSVGIGLSGVTADGREYEVVADGTALHRDDWLRITTTRVVEGLSYVFVVGLQDGRDPIWYYPDPEHEERASQPVPRGTGVPLGAPGEPFEVKVEERHQAGRLKVLAIFSAEPLSLDTVRDLVSQSRLPADLQPWNAAAGGLATDAIIRMLEVEVVPGSRSGNGADGL